VQHILGGKNARNRERGSENISPGVKDIATSQKVSFKAISFESSPRPKSRHRNAIKYQPTPEKSSIYTQQDYFIKVVIEHFTPVQEIPLVNTANGIAACLDSRLCGAWVTLLPELAARSSQDSDVLKYAIEALGYAILGQINNEEDLVAKALEARGKTLRSLQKVLVSAQQAPLEQLLATILCLFLTEVD